MKHLFFLLETAIFASLAFSLAACKGEPPKATIVEIDKKMPLLEWPDSAYVNNLDSILASEPVKKTDVNKPSIAINAHEAPKFILPGSVTGKKEAPKAARKPGDGKGAGKSALAGSPDNGAEAFMDKFSRALSALQSDPSNAGLYKVVEAKEGDDLFKLLRRTYGAGTQNLPRFYVLSALQSVNAGVMLEHLNAGDKVRVPRI
ncbi:hypothetical protein [Fibrobacter sp. UBA4309]|uniref:hypothetical protein n=1 Tax=Fibrobacter sp. UBA4309 TaxID=1946537 RepID=UPI0025C0F88E|nr:hypothetical protein [Fibrobacter sp. UBA4309]